ncbi:Clavaminate synthase-like protein [Laetiporus sulphureus 93-53]|uniref:Clavaminate synthase-like protein n=1 Tax=Laetiporus sulphureus 93-53 TaxID=1314785 RepID=A0A165G9E9_9APHY|nr:Clavaminate synthase-like protein [Laetiporus sulphureus 93-53]KZT10019.1 Clavaminate synthase-like protein [Laetiporus sulphureus 93-53]
MASTANDALPPFPDDVPTHPLPVVDYARIRAGDETERDKLWNAATQLGFWYLKNHGVEDEMNALFDLGKAFMGLPLEEKMQYEEGDDGMQFGYKAAGYHTADEHGTLDATEFLDIAKDDVLAYPTPVHRTYPPLVADAFPSIIIPFVQKSLVVNHTLLGVLGAKLGMAPGVIEALHKTEERSGCVARVIRTPSKEGAPEVLEEQALLGAHTDFGSLSFLHNRLGGLQVLAPGTENWLYVRPLPDHAICNVGDALNIFSGGLIRFNMHRVVAPPKAQSAYERYSLSFFTRPHDSVVLRPLSAESPVVAAAVATGQVGLESQQEDRGTAGEWLVRRLRNLRTANYHGVESYRDHLGTEDYGKITQVATTVAM